MLIWVAYGVIGLVVAVAAAAWEIGRSYPQERCACGAVGLALGAVWPITLTAVALGACCWCVGQFAERLVLGRTVRLRGRLQCALGRHDWEQHPAFVGFRARRCTRCGRVEADVFRSGWKHRPHLDGVSVEDIEIERDATQALADAFSGHRRGER